MTIENETAETEVNPEVQETEAAADDMQTPVFNRIQVQDVVKREKQKAFERGKREALMELQQQQQAQETAPQQQAQAPQSMGGMPQMSQEDIQRMIAEQAPQALQAHVQQLQNENMVNSFVSKMQAAEQKYPGLEADLSNLNYEDPRLVRFIGMVNNMDNTGEIMKEVMDNPSKMESLLNMAQNQPYQAQKALKSLSDSIKTNQEALAEDAQARDPMSQLKPSTNAGMDNGAMSVTDYRKMFRG